MNNLTANDYKILASIASDKNKGLSKVTALTKAELIEKTGLSYSKVRDALILLTKCGFVDNGISRGKATTVYITKEGLEELNSIATISKLVKGGNINE